MESKNNEKSPLLKTSHNSNSFEQWSSKNSGTSSNLGQESEKQNRILSLLHLIFPLLVWLPKYIQHWKELLKYDLLAGLTAGVTIIPKNIAYASVAGLDPIFGIYASFFPSFIYLLFGSSRHLLVGPTAVISLLVADALKSEDLSDNEYIRRTLQMSFLAGLFCLIIGIFQLGFVAKFISRPVVAGFTYASAIMIGCSQINPFLGIKAKSHSSLVYYTLKTTIMNIEHTNYICVIIGTISFAIIFATKKVKLTEMLPVSLIVVVGCTILAWLLRLDNYGVPIVGHVPSGFPMPDYVIFKSWDEFSKAAGQSVLIALIALLESYSIAKTFATKCNYNITPNQELVALGMANFVGSFFSCYPVTGSFTGTAVNHRAGAKSGTANLVACCTVFIVMMALTPLIKYLPSACLAAIVLSAIVSLIDFQYIIFLWRTNKEDFSTLVVCFGSAIAVGIELGVCIGIIFSVLIVVYHVAHPKLSSLGLQSKNQENILSETNINDLKVVDAAQCNVELERVVIIRMESPLLFLNAETLKDALLSLVWYGTFQSQVTGWKGNKPMYDSFRNSSIQNFSSSTPNQAIPESRQQQQPLNMISPQIVILDMSYITTIDATGIEVLLEIHAILQQTHVKLFFAETRKPVLEMLQQSHALEKIGTLNFFITVVEAAKEAHKFTSSLLSVGFTFHHSVLEK